MIEVFGSNGFVEGDRVCVVGMAFDGTGTVRREDGKLVVVLDAKIESVDATVRIRVCDCTHGECDERQLARGEDPRNYAESASLVEPSEWERIVGRTHREGQCAVELGARMHKAAEMYLGSVDEFATTAGVRCECGSGSHVRGPGHSSYCKLYEP